MLKAKKLFLEYCSNYADFVLEAITIEQFRDYMNAFAKNFKTLTQKEKSCLYDLLDRAEAYIIPGDIPTHY